MKIDINKVDLTNQNQKIFAGILLVFTLVGLYFLLPPFIVLLKNLWLAAILGIPVVFVVMNPLLIWNIYKQVSWNLTKALISQDKLGYMYRYYDYLVEELKQVEESMVSVGGVKNQLERAIAELENGIENKARKGVNAQKMGNEAVAKDLGMQIKVDTDQVEVLKPQLTTAITQENYLREIFDFQQSQINGLKYTLDSKAREYELMQKVNTATKKASGILNTTSERHKAYQESLRQIENSVTSYVANVQNFQRQVKPMLERMSVEKSMNEEEGMKLIEDFKNKSVTLKIEG